MTRMSLNQHGSSKADVVIKLVLVFFISLLSFSIGTFVGKKFSDNQYKLSQLEPSVEQHDSHGAAERGIASVPPTEDPHPGKALSDEEIAKMAEEFVEDGAESPVPEKYEEPTAVVAQAAPAQAPAAAQPTAKVVEQPSAAAVKVSENKAPELKKPTPVAARIPQSLPKETAASAIGKYTVQIGAYPSEPEAQKVADGLKEQGFSAFFVPATVKGKNSNEDKTWYRVSIGLFTTRAEADKYMKDLVTRKKIASGFVQQIKN